ICNAEVLTFRSEPIADTMSLKPASTLLLFVLFTFSVAARQVYVSPDGDDSNDGSRRLPMKTISAAQTRALELQANGPKSEVTVWLADGIYPIVEALEFKPFASGELSFKALKGA